jgi:hypothetical protein
LSHNGQSQKIKTFHRRDAEKNIFVVVNHAAAAVNNKLAFPLCLCASAVQSFDFVFNVAFWPLTDHPIKKTIHQLGKYPYLSMVQLPIILFLLAKQQS